MVARAVAKAAVIIVAARHGGDAGGGMAVASGVEGGRKEKKDVAAAAEAYRHPGGITSRTNGQMGHRWRRNSAEIEAMACSASLTTAGWGAAQRRWGFQETGGKVPIWLRGSIDALMRSRPDPAVSDQRRRPETARGHTTRGTACARPPPRPPKPAVVQSPFSVAALVFSRYRDLDQPPDPSVTSLRLKRTMHASYPSAPCEVQQSSLRPWLMPACSSRILLADHLIRRPRTEITTCT